MRAAHQLQVGDARAALAFAAEVADCADPAELTDRIDALPRLIGAEGVVVTACHDWNVAGTIEAGDPSVYTPELVEAIARNWREHPVMASDVAGGGQGARRVSDFVASRAWRRGALFNDFYRRLGMTRELSAQLAWGPPGSSCCITLHRGGRDFGPRDVALLDVLAPHLRAARARIAERADAGRPDADRPGTEDPGAGHAAPGRPEPSAAPLARRLPLTPRQAEVLARLAAGRTNGGIAADLGISPNTVARHVEQVYARLGVRTRVAAARAAFAALGD